MRRGKYVARPLTDQPAQPFCSAEEAWLWFCQCQIARRDGVRFGAGRADIDRPCDPDDIYRAVVDLNRRGVIGQGHLAVLGRFGRRLAPPDPWTEPGAATLWAEALDRLETILRAKEIIW